MSNAAKNIMTRVIKRRLDVGEKLDDIFMSYPKLKKSEKEELKNTVS